MKASREYLKNLGFKELPHFTVMNSLEYHLGRRRRISVGCLGEPNEVVFISETSEHNPREVTDVICLHNWDYDGYLTEEKISTLVSALKLLTTKTENHEYLPESQQNNNTGQ